MESVNSMMQRSEHKDESDEALQLVKHEERPELGAGADPADGAGPAGGGAEGGAEQHSVITSRRAMRTITAAGHITDAAELHDDGVKDEPPEQPPLDHDHVHYSKLEEESGRAVAAHYEEERLRLAEAETARYLSFKQEPYRAAQSPPDKRAQAQYRVPLPPRAPYGRGLSLRYGAPHQVIVAQEGEPEEHAHEFLKDKDQLQYGGEQAAQDGRQYAVALADHVAASSALEMIQTTSLSNQQAVGVAYQQVTTF